MFSNINLKKENGMSDPKVITSMTCDELGNQLLALHAQATIECRSCDKDEYEGCEACNKVDTEKKERLVQSFLWFNEDAYLETLGASRLASPSR
jgi:hypothetical protein